MRYAASLNAGLGGLMRTLWAQPKGNGALDAMKVAEGESTIAKNNAGIGKDNAEADKITKRLRDMYDPQFNQDVSSGMLPNATPEQRASATINMLRLTDNPQHLTDSFGKGLDQSNYQRALDDPNFAPNFNRANAAKDGKMYSNVGDSGLVLSQANGLQGVGNQPQYKSQLAKTVAETGRANAQAGQADSVAKLNKSRVNQPKTNPVDVFRQKEQIKSKIRAEEAAREKLVNATGGLGLLDSYIAALTDAPQSGVSQDIASAAGYFGMGSKKKLGAIARLTQASEALVNYAQKQPGPSTDKDVQSYRAQMGVVTNRSLPAAAKIQAAEQAKALLKKIEKKYGNYSSDALLDQPNQDDQIIDFNDYQE
jgi:hypothetical protein